MISLYIVCLVLVIVGALNWGLVGAANVNLVSSVTSLVSSNPSTVNMANRVVYVTVGVAALYVLWCDWERIIHGH
jgi:uncharacterized membrane protein YuzA (DUF378 family)